MNVFFERKKISMHVFLLTYGNGLRLIPDLIKKNHKNKIPVNCHGDEEK